LTYAAPLSGRNRLTRILWEQACLPAAARRLGCEVLHGPAYVLPLRWRGPSVLTVHDLLTLTHPEWCKRANVWHFRAVLPRALRQATRIVVPSATVGEEVAGRPGGEGSRVRVLPWGIAPRFRPAPAEEQERVRARYGLSGPYLLAVGVIEPKKNHAGLLQIFRRMVEEIPHQLLIAGREGWGDRRPWERALKELPPGRVKVLGYVPAGDLPALYSGTDLCLELSWYEGFGIPPLEAMACGAATAVSNRGALPEISGPGALVVDPADQPETARALLRLLGDAEERRALAARGKAHAAQFTWARHVEGLLEVYREAVKDSRQWTVDRGQ
jgi:glycosyltransferase involved in cell wall biosynthesis